MAEWRQVRLDEVCERVSVGHVGPTSEFFCSSNQGVPLIRSQNVRPGQLNINDIRHITRDFHIKTAKSQLKPGDILIVRVGQNRGDCCVVPKNFGEANCANVVFARPQPEFGPFLAQYLKSSEGYQRLRGLSTGSAQEVLNTKSIASLRINLPPKNEAREIGSLLGYFDDKIELNQRMNATLEAMARAIFKDWFVDFGPARAKAEGRPPYLAPNLWALFPNALDDDDKPVGWEFKPVGQLVAFNPSESLSKGSETPYLDMAALPTQGSWPEPPIQRPFASGSKFRDGDTLLARITPCLENGKTAFVQCLGEGAVGWGSTEFIVLRPKQPFPLEYGYLLAREDGFRDRAIQSMTGTSGRQRVQTDSLAGYEVILPDEPVLRAFGNLIRPWFAMIRANAEQSQTLAGLRDLLLPKLMSGEIRLRAAEKAVEAVA